MRDGPLMDDASLPQAHASAPISRLVAEVAAQCPGDRITLGEMATACAVGLIETLCFGACSRGSFLF